MGRILGLSEQSASWGQSILGLQRAWGRGTREPLAGFIPAMHVSRGWFAQLSCGCSWTLGIRGGPHADGKARRAFCGQAGLPLPPSLGPQGPLATVAQAPGLHVAELARRRLALRSLDTACGSPVCADSQAAVWPGSWALPAPPESSGEEGSFPRRPLPGGEIAAQSP